MSTIFKFHDESIKLLTKVRYIRELKRNMISLGELDKKGYMFKGEHGALKVLRRLNCILLKLNM